MEILRNFNKKTLKIKSKICKLKKESQRKINFVQRWFRRQKCAKTSAVY